MAGLIARGIGTGAGVLFSVIRAVVLGPAQVAALIPPAVAPQLQQQFIGPTTLLGVNGGPAEAFAVPPRFRQGDEPLTALVGL